MEPIWCCTLNVRTVSESNSSEHWCVKSKRHKKQKMALKKTFLLERPMLKLPCYVMLTRIAPRFLDAHDNLPASMKWILDGIADYLLPGKAAGRADDSNLISWGYKQEKGNPRQYGVKIEIFNV